MSEKRLERQLDLLLAWVRASESRLVFMLSLSTAMLGVITITSRGNADWWMCTKIMAIIVSGCLALGIGSCIWSAFPRTKGSTGSLIFFGGISYRELDEYAQMVNARTHEEYIKDLVEQCHVNARIAAEKYKWVGKSMKFVSVGFVAWLVWLTLLVVQTW